MHSCTSMHRHIVSTAGGLHTLTCVWARTGIHNWIARARSVFVFLCAVASRACARLLPKERKGQSQNGPEPFVSPLCFVVACCLVVSCQCSMSMSDAPAPLPLPLNMRSRGGGRQKAALLLLPTVDCSSVTAAVARGPLAFARGLWSLGGPSDDRLSVYGLPLASRIMICLIQLRYPSPHPITHYHQPHTPITHGV
jgi:hypothetical protein